MAFLVFDYKCPSCGHEEIGKVVKSHEKDDVNCPACSKDMMQRQVAAPNLDWDSLARGENASPEAIRHFNKKRKQQREKETKSMREHGDYGPRPGA